MKRTILNVECEGTAESAKTMLGRESFAVRGANSAFKEGST